MQDKSTQKETQSKQIGLIFEPDFNLYHYAVNHSTKNHLPTLLKFQRNIKQFDEGIEFKDLVLFAIDYFYKNIFGYWKDEQTFKRYKTPKGHWTIEKVKSFLDAHNHTSFTPVVRLTGDYKNLYNAENYTAVYLIIQTAYFHATRYGQHQYLEYVEHYINTGEKLPERAYKYEIDVLQKKYTKIDDAMKKGESINVETERRLWYYSTIDILLNELDVDAVYYPSFHNNKDDRFFNPLAMTARTLRKVQAFKMYQIDISSAYPTMIDRHVGADVGARIYDNLASSLNISRQDAKRRFNIALNSGAYRNTPSKKNAFRNDLVKAGYTPEQADVIMRELTDNPNRKFYFYAVAIERQLMDRYKKADLRVSRATRVHDAFYIVERNDVNYNTFLTDLNGFTFKIEPINEIAFNFETQYSYQSGAKRFRFAPDVFENEEKPLATKVILQKAREYVGTFDDDINGVHFALDFFKSPEIYQTADLMYFDFGTFERKFKTFEQWATAFGISLNLLVKINPEVKVLTRQNLRRILMWHRRKSAFCFDIETALKRFETYEPSDVLPEVLEKDFNLKCKVSLNDFDFINCIRQARGVVYGFDKVQKFLDEFEGALSGKIFMTSQKHDTELNQFKQQINLDIFGVKRPKVTKTKKTTTTYIELSNMYRQFSKNLSLIKHKERKIKALEKINQIAQQKEEAKAKLERLNDIYDTIVERKKVPAELEFLRPKLEYYFEVLKTREKAEQTPVFQITTEQPTNSTTDPTAFARSFAHLFTEKETELAKLANFEYTHPQNQPEREEAKRKYNVWLNWYLNEVKFIDNLHKGKNKKALRDNLNALFFDEVQFIEKRTLFTRITA